jgi:hypothetical protein
MTRTEAIMRVCQSLGLIGEGAAIIRKGGSVQDAQELVRKEKQFKRLRSADGRDGVIRFRL